MTRFFAEDWTGEPFHLFGTGHLIALAVILAINLSFIWLRKSQRQSLKDGVRYAIAAGLVIAESSWHIWNLVIGEWTIQTHLPLHLCAVMLWSSVIMLLTKNYRIFEFAYFLGIGGAAQAVITPEAGIYGFPHYRVFQTLFAHGAIITAGIFMTLVEGFRPSWASLKRVLIWLGVYAAAVTGINVLIGSNYLYTLRKPPTASLIDFLGPWPLYLIPLALIAILLSLILYLPWMIKDIKSRPLMIAGDESG